MKFFIAAPWRYKEIVKGLCEELAQQGYEVYSFLQSGSNRMSGESIISELKTFSDSMRNWQQNPEIKRIFDTELEGIKNSDALILLEPAGHSSLIEAGIAFGLGKKVIIIGHIEKPEVFYFISEAFYASIDEFLNDLGRIAPK
jgi:hypothetical protein